MANNTASKGAKLRRAVWVVSGKGGVGKTQFSRTLINHMRSLGIGAAVYDGDGEIGGLARMLGCRDGDGKRVNDPVASVGWYNLHDDGERPTLLNSIALKTDLLVHDLPGNPFPDLARIVDSGEGIDGLIAAHEGHGVRITFVHVVDNEIESAQSVGFLVGATGDRVDHVAVLNMRECKSRADFPYWVGYQDPESGKALYGKGRSSFLDVGGVEVELPALPPATRAKVNAEKLTYSDAARSERLTITEQTHCAKYMRDFAASIAPAKHLLGL